MIDILLVKPQGGNNAIQIYPPIGLGFLSTYLKKRGYTARILDCDLKNIPPSSFSKSVNLARYRVIGFGVFTINMEKVKHYLQIIKKHNNSVITIVGGPQVASDPINTLRYLQCADFAVYGEGESSLAAFLYALRCKSLDEPAIRGRIHNLAWRDGNGYKINILKFEDNLDEIGPPDWNEINPRNYDTAVHGFFCKKLPIAPIIVTRGCPYKCKFCGGRNITGYKVRARNPVNVIEEIEILKYRYGIQEFQVVDDNFTAERPIAMQFCKTLIQKRLDMPWSCPNGIRLDTLDDELLEIMYKSGCYEVAVGIESGSQRILKSMNKGITIKLICEKVNLIHKHKINAVGFIMVGYPTETAVTVEKSRRLALELPLLRVSLTRFSPFPGTPIAEELIQSKKVSRDELDFSKLSYMSFSYIPEDLTKLRLKWLFLKFFITFYSRPHIILQNIKGLHSFKQFKLVLRKIMNFIFGI